MLLLLLRDAPLDLPKAINCLTIASLLLQMSLVSTSSTILPQVFNNISVEYQKQAIDAGQSSDTVEEKLEDTDAAQWLQCPAVPSATNCFTITPRCATSSFTPPLHPDVTLSTGSQRIFFVLGCIDLEDNSASFGRYSGHKDPNLHNFRFLFTFCSSPSSFGHHQKYFTLSQTTPHIITQWWTIINGLLY